MTLRPYDARGAGGGGSRTPSICGSAHSAPRGHSVPAPRGHGGGAMVPRGSGGDPFGDMLNGGLFGGRDPFAEFGAMAPFGGMGGMGGMGGLMKQFDEMAKGMGRSSGAQGADFGGMFAGMPGGNGQYACQSFAMCSRTGPDGKQHVEKFTSSDVGNTQHKIRESQQAYSNSSTRMDKMALER
eukprot:TRINITY_DN3832_c0_g1_i2.p2 TRINITY_DN3832_c0_g1~~TRINITY_DN3832_c0_g1_i2.p2  ORF type:complete len:183 (-),score=34.73 TRINITY_DN3832_c0_g1_i2:63-611(-)